MADRPSAFSLMLTERQCRRGDERKLQAQTRETALLLALLMAFPLGLGGLLGGDHFGVASDREQPTLMKLRRTFADSWLAGLWQLAEVWRFCGSFGLAPRQNHRRPTVRLTVSRGRCHVIQFSAMLTPSHLQEYWIPGTSEPSHWAHRSCDHRRGGFHEHNEKRGVIFSTNFRR